MAARLLLVVLSLLASGPAQETVDWRSFFYLSKDARDKFIEEMTKNSAALQNQRNEAVKQPALPAAGLGVPIDRRPTVDDDILFLKKMKEQSEIYQRETQPVFMSSIPAPPFVPYKPLPYYFIPAPNYFDLPGTRIFAAPPQFPAERTEIRQQLPLRGVYPSV